MGRQIIRTNYASVSGIAISDFQKEREDFGRNQYVSDIEVRRLSGRTDRIPVMAPAKLLEDAAGCKGQYVCVAGRYHSMNYYDGKKRRVKLFVYAGVLAVQAEDGGMCDRNYIFLDGYLCRKPIFRTTPLGRTITDLLVAVNSAFGISDYIPCVCWESTAHLASSLPVGSHIGIEGRLQSREYMKQIPGREPERRIAYEVSVSKLRVRES